MNSKHIKTKSAILSQPVPKTITWNEVISLLQALGCTITKHEGSAVTFHKGKIPLFLHRPHPETTLKIYAVKKIKDFLTQIGEIP
jgi:predicted RNA binding protein YcfA (HicA-like mRNA interferase family)